MINISIGKQMYHENEKKIVEIYHPNWQFDTRVDLVNSFWHQIIQQSFRGKKSKQNQWYGHWNRIKNNTQFLC